MKYFIIAGERSGDLHGSNLIKAIKNADAKAEVVAWGGDYMENSGAKILKHYKDLAFMGFLEVIQNILTILGFFKECKTQISDFQPDAIILIDYAGFNLRIAKWAKKNGFRVYYYISPKVWAWNQNRAKKIKATVDKLYVIFPFEVDFFKKYNYEVEYVGNPLYDEIQNFKPNPKFKIESDKKIIALLPGSRKQEVINMLDLMTQAASHFADYQFIIAGVDNLPKDLYQPFLKKNIHIIYNQTYDLLRHSTAALVTSGTATLETAIFKVPQVVCYKSSWISYQIAKLLIKVPFISLVNLIAQKEVIKELIQNDLTVENLKIELSKLLTNNNFRNSILSDYEAINQILNKRNASENAGKSIVNDLVSHS